MKTKISILLVLSMLLTPLAELKASAQGTGRIINVTTVTTATAETISAEEAQAEADGAEAHSYEVDFAVTSSWPSNHDCSNDNCYNYNATITIENTGDTTIHNWHLSFDSEDTLESVWNGAVFLEEDDHYVIKNVGWNGDIAPGESVTFGFLATCEGEPDEPEGYTLPVGRIPVEREAYRAEFQVENTWGGSFSGAEITLTNQTGESIEDWILGFDFAGDITLLWDGEILNREGDHYTVGHVVNNQDIPAGGEITLGFNGDFTKAVSGNDVPFAVPENLILYRMGYDPEMDQAGQSGGTTGTEGGTLGENGQGATGSVSGNDVSGNDVSGNNPLEDLDSDGLPDGYELYTLYPLLLQKGLDEEAGMNPEEDYDGDGLTSLEEYLADTNPGNADTDGDGLGDYEEIYTHETDPNNLDSDGDGLNDALELKHHMDPDSTDSDGDGTTDDMESLTQELTVAEYSAKPLSEAGVLPTLEITGCGDFSQKLTILDISYNKMYENTGFILGSACEFAHDKEPAFESATLTFTVDESLLMEHRLEDLAIAWYDNENSRTELLPTTCDTSKNTLTAELSHFSTYVVVDEATYQNNLNEAYFSQQENITTYNGHSYILFGEGKTYEEAEAFCKELGGSLAVLETEEELGVIHDWLKELSAPEDIWVKEAETGERMVLVEGETVYLADWQGTPYRYRHHTEQEYTNTWLSNITYTSTLVSPYPMFAFHYGSGTREGIGQVPVDYYEVYVFDESDKRTGLCGIACLDVVMERYTHYTSASGEKSHALYDRRFWEESAGSHFFYGPSDYIYPRSVERLEGSTPAYTVFDTELPVFSRYEDVLAYFGYGDQSGQLNPGAVNSYRTGLGMLPFVCEIDRELPAKGDGPTKVLLSNGKFVTLDADPALGDLTVDTDADGIPDLIELGIPKTIKLQGTDLEITEWQHRSDPVLEDTDNDGLRDDNDIDVDQFNIAIEGVYDNVIRLNTGKVWNLSIVESLDEFYQNYYTRTMLPGSMEALESIKAMLDMNNQNTYTATELAFLQMIDRQGVINYMQDKDDDLKIRVLSLVRGEECGLYSARDAYNIITSEEAWEKYKNIAIGSMVSGRYTDETNLAGVAGELALAFTGLDVAMDFRDLTYDIHYWKTNWEHAGQTFLDGMCLLPIVGVVGKSDEFWALVKRSDVAMELIQLRKLEDIKNLEGALFIANGSYYIKTAGSALKDLGAAAFKKIMDISDYCNFGGRKYGTPITVGCQNSKEAFKYLEFHAPHKAEEIISEAATQTGKSSDEVQEFVEEALEDARKKVEIEGGSSTFKYKEVKTFTAEETNQWFIDNVKPDYKPPYKPGTIVKEIELTENTTFVRVYDNMPDGSGMYGSWVMKAEDIEGLTPLEIQNKFALPNTPKYVCDVELEAGTHIRVGEVNPLDGWGSGGGTQYDLIGQRIGDFKNERLLEGN